MWFVRRSVGTCARRTVLCVAQTAFVSNTRHCTTSPTSPASSTHAPTAGVSLSYTCHLLDSICDANQPTSVKRKRIRGAVRTMEADVVNSFAAASAVLAPNQTKEVVLRRWLHSLARSVEYLPRRETHSIAEEGEVEPGRFSTRPPRFHDRSARRGDDADEWSGASPFFSLQTSDVLCLCLRECAMGAAASTQPDALLELLKCAVALELGEVEVLQHIVYALTKANVCRQRSPSEAVQLLHFISLAVKRCKLPPPPLDRVLSVLPSSTLTSRENLMVLSALHRIPTAHAGDVVASVSRKAATQAAAYNVKDVVYGLEVSAMLAGCNEVYVAAILDRTSELAPTMTPRQLGSVCKYVSLLSPSRRHDTLALSCGAELRRLLPLLVERAEQLLGQFHLRDSRNVLRCFREHKVRHSLIFSRLTPIAEDN